MRKTDTMWLLALPVYLTIGTVRHEGAHALAAMLQGATITDFRFLPLVHPDYGFKWGLMNWTGGETTSLVFAAPYLADMLFFALFSVLCTAISRMPRWVWINIFIIGVVSPLTNTAYNYLCFFDGSEHHDVTYLARVHGTTVVHAFFVVAILAYVVGTALVVVRRLGTQGHLLPRSQPEV
jgi:hypothetical protein